MPLAIMFAIMATIAMLFFGTGRDLWEKTPLVQTGGVNNSSGTFMREKQFKEYGGIGFSTPEHYDRYNAEAIETVLLRTCRMLNTTAKKNNCTNWDDENTLWAFVGPVGSRGSLATAWSSSTTGVFSCSHLKEYGRYAIQRAIPKQAIVAGGWKYNLMGVGHQPGYTDPCGYRQIVDK